MKERFLSREELNAVPGEAYRSFPLVVDGEGASPSETLERFRGFDLDDMLSRHGAVLLRNFQIGDAIDDALAVLDADFATPSIGNQTLREKVTRRTATSTGAPSFYYIPQHIEWNYNGRLPDKLAFFCEKPPESDGCTVIVDNRKLTQELPAPIMEKLRANYLYQFAFSSQYTASDLLAYFDVSREEEAHQKMSELGFTMEGDGKLLQSVRSCLIRHPRTGDLLLAMPLEYMYGKALRNGIANVMKFSQKNKARYLGILLLAYCTEQLGKKLVPSRIIFEDEGLTAKEYRTYLRVLDANKVFFTWQKDDLLVVDNLLVTHGKQPHSGKRKIRVSLGELLDRDALSVEG